MVKIAMVSVKISEEDYELLVDLKHQLRKQKMRLSQQQLLDRALKFSLKNREEFLKELEPSKKKMSRREAVEKLLSGSRVYLGENWLEEIDTID